jgi:hypothetical protein
VVTLKYIKAAYSYSSDWLRTELGSIPGMARFFSYPQRPDLPWDPIIQWIRWSLSPWVKRPGRERDQSPPSSADVKNGGAILPLPQMSS